MKDESGDISPYLPSDMPEALVPARHQRARQAWDQALRGPLGLEGAARGSPEAWFLGPKAENVAAMRSAAVPALGHRRGAGPPRRDRVDPQSLFRCIVISQLHSQTVSLGLIVVYRVTLRHRPMPMTRVLAN